MTTFGLMSRQAEGSIVSRTITGGSGRIIVQNGNAQTNNPFLDLADTAVVVGTYNPVGLGWILLLSSVVQQDLRLLTHKLHS